MNEARSESSFQRDVEQRKDERPMPKVMLRYGSPIWFRFLAKGSPGMVPLGFHDGYVVVRFKNRIWKVIGGGPMKPTLREVYRHDFTRPA